ncbi:MAG: ABC transporter ATP-binding protein [Candidatus Thermoplasmatota archaeon]|nr:ABC transporter ATP-binding protein [Candidatus Thermoplasmatota archaeon]
MSREVVVKIHGLKKYFEIRKGFLNIFAAPAYVKAVDNIDFELRAGEILGLVGESGCGKTTTGRLMTRLDNPTSGSVFFMGRDISLLEGEDLKIFRRNIQMVFQDPYESLSPRTTVLQTIMEPLMNHNIGETFEERIEMVVKALEDAGLAPAREYLDRFPHELSGGQRQRVSIARALVINPKIIIADEPVSMLDVSIRAGVLNLMLDLRDKYMIPYVFITHDIAVARYISDRLAVMYLGKIVELGETDSVVFEPKHPYTQALISAVPVPDPEQKHGRAKIAGEIPSAIDLPLGCRFRPRCPQAFERCGWQARDLVDWLLEEERVAEESHPMFKHIGPLRPEGFVLTISIKQGGDPKAVKDWLEAKRAELKESRAMFRAMLTADDTLGDREVRVNCSSVSVGGEVVAREVMELLKESVDFKARAHPMYGTILDVTQADSYIVIKVGEEDAEAQAAIGKTRIESAVGYMQDFVKYHRRKSGYTEFTGVKAITGDAEARTVTIECGSAKMAAKRVAKEVAQIIEHDFMQGPGSTVRETFLPLVVRGSTIVVRITGSERRWDELAAFLKKHFDKKAEKLPVAKGVSSVTLRQTKSDRDIVAVRFLLVEEPPLVDVGGHLVACYLYVPRPAG